MPDNYRRIKVCVWCLSHAIVDISCECVVERNHKTIPLDFKECSCCGHLDMHYANTEFNSFQLKKLSNNETYDE